LQALFLLNILPEHLVHFSYSLVKALSAGDFLKHSQKTLLTALDDGVYLALLNYLKLALGLERESRGFESGRELAGRYLLVVPVENFFAGLDEVALFKSNCLVRDYQFLCGIVDGQFHPDHVVLVSVSGLTVAFLNS